MRTIERVYCTCLIIARKLETQCDSERERQARFTANRFCRYCSGMKSIRGVICPLPEVLTTLSENLARRGLPVTYFP